MRFQINVCGLKVIIIIPFIPGIPELKLYINIDITISITLSLVGSNSLPIEFYLLPLLTKLQ